MQKREIAWEAELRGVSSERVIADYIAQTPVGRLEEPEDVARRSSLPLFRCGPFHDGSRHKRNWRGLYFVTA
jgi:hypothetical protein